MIVTILVGLILGLLQNGASKGLNPTGRIVGGQEADIADYPYQLALMDGGLFFCGASLISSTWALTSAHCMIGITASTLTVQANSSSISTGVTKPVTKIIIHEKFSYNTAENDIALLQLASPLECMNCKTIPLATEDPKQGETVVITGWGTTSEFDSDESEILQYVELPIVDRATCQEMYNGTENKVTDEMFCAQYPGGGKDSCIGDSGGPVAIDGVLYGIVSWSIGCALAAYPGVNTNVVNYSEWIKKHIGGEL
ncbi:hypothetical protein JTB14_024509 [Gonioctena quinquepunctata]|nr:hypothetical protein JTB14_024509 [Gonioctena quinquepunctata]